MKTDDNVVYPEFRKPSPVAFPTMTFTCETLYADEYAKLIRMTYRVGNQTYIQHIASGVGLDA